MALIPSISTSTSTLTSSENEALQFNILGQVFGYLCAVFYLGSRLPQIRLNYLRKSTDGLNFLFFLFACIGNLTYVLSIFAFEGKCQGRKGRCEPGEAARLYGRYIAVNASWLAGSLGTLFLDMVVFVQFFMYRQRDEEEEEDSAIGNDNPQENEVPNRSSFDDRPLLQRGDSTWSGPQVR